MTRHPAPTRTMARVAAGVALLAALAVGTAARAQNAQEVLVEVRIHGNYATPDAEVLKLAGLMVGQPLEAGALREVEDRLRQGGRFENVEIRKRYRSMDRTSEVALVVIVQEHPLADEGPPTPIGPLKQVVGSMQFLPVLNYEDGYGFTYGGRVTFTGVLGRDGRMSVPLTWGGTKRAAFELDKTFARGPVDRLEGGLSVSGRKNPYFRLADHREEGWVGVRRQLAKPLSVGVGASYARVSLGDVDDTLATCGADVTLDTRADPVFPRNAVFARVAWDGLDPRAAPYANRLRFDARGYTALVGQSVLSLRWQYGMSSASLPPYEQFLLGGANTLRGYRPGSLAGDNLMAATAEVRVPLSSPLRLTRAGVSLFADVGTTYLHGTGLTDGRFRVGGGGGVFLLAGIINLSLDVGIRRDSVRAHFTTGLQF
jgi:outer membrane protein assembly factor BamA